MLEKSSPDEGRSSQTPPTSVRTSAMIERERESHNLRDIRSGGTSDLCSLFITSTTAAQRSLWTAVELETNPSLWLNNATNTVTPGKSYNDTEF